MKNLSFKQNYSSPDPSMALLPSGKGFHDSYEKLQHVLTLTDIFQNDKSMEDLLFYLADNWPRLCNEPNLLVENSKLAPCSRCKGGTGGKTCFPCRAKCYTSCKHHLKHCPKPLLSDKFFDFLPIGGGLGSEILELINNSFEAFNIIAKTRYELGKYNGKCIKEMYKSLVTPKSQGLPLTVTTLLTFAERPFEHKDIDGSDVMRFSFFKFFGFSETNEEDFKKVLLIEKCTAGPWIKGYIEEMATVNLDISWPEKNDELIEIRIKQY